MAATVMRAPSNTVDRSITLENQIIREVKDSSRLSNVHNHLTLRLHVMDLLRIEAPLLLYKPGRTASTHHLAPKLAWIPLRCHPSK